MLNYEKWHEENMKNPNFRKDWEALEPWYQAEKAKIDARLAREARRRKPKIANESIRVKASL
jgi:hypothetical protein